MGWLVVTKMHVSVNIVFIVWKTNDYYAGVGITKTQTTVRGTGVTSNG